jgi:glycosyltransferase involved in cell wall biosynthesis
VAPTLSIVTINLNNAAGLARTLASVRAQSLRAYELVVVDGGSQDESVEVIRAHEDLITEWVSEPDAGIYDAQNKGIRRSRGEYLLFLNSGDLLAAEDVLERCSGGGFEEDIVYSDVIYEDEGGARRLRRFPDPPTFELFMRSSLCHQATLIRRSVFERFGLYDTSLTIAADYDLFMRAIVLAGVSTRHLSFPLAVHDTTGISWRSAQVDEERDAVQRRTLSPALLAHWEEYDRVTRSLWERIRDAVRPVARKLRSISRAVRGLPDPAQRPRPRAPLRGRF